MIVDLGGVEVAVDLAVVVFWAVVAGTVVVFITAIAAVVLQSTYRGAHGQPTMHWPPEWWQRRRYVGRHAEGQAVAEPEELQWPEPVAAVLDLGSPAPVYPPYVGRYGLVAA